MQKHAEACRSMQKHAEAFGVACVSAIYHHKYYIRVEGVRSDKHTNLLHYASYREYQRGKYHCTIDLLFDWFGLVCFANKNKNCQLSYSKFQTCQTGGQWYSDTSSFRIPC